VEAKEVMACQCHTGSRQSVVVGLVERLFVGSGVKLVWNCSNYWRMIHQRDAVSDCFVDVPCVHAVEICAADDGTKFGNARLTHIRVCNYVSLTLTL